MEEEQKWIRDIQRRGSRQAADKLVRAHYNEMYRFAYRQLDHKEDALDLTQTIFLAVFRALPSLDGRKASFRTWLYRVAAHKAIECRRKIQGTVTPLEETEATNHTNFAAQVQDRDLLDLMGLADAANKKLKTFSGGMRQRVGIAVAMLTDPKLLLDEPTVGLDPRERVRFRNLTHTLAADRIVILSTHIVSDIETIAGQIGTTSSTAVTALARSVSSGRERCGRCRRRPNWGRSSLSSARG